MKTEVQLIKETLKGVDNGYIPVIPCSVGYAITHGPFSPPECMSDPVKFVENAMHWKNKLGYNAIFPANITSVAKFYGEGKINRFGKVSEDGHGTVYKPEHMKDIRPYDPEKDQDLKFACDAVKYAKEKYPDVYTLCIVQNPPMEASNIMEGAYYFINMKKNPDFVHELTEHVFEPIWQSTKAIIDAGIDAIWTPMPTLSGTCLSRKQYEEFCHSYIKRFNDRVKATGVDLFFHNCGDWNGRFDLVLEEKPDCIHVTLTDFAKLKAEFGDKVTIMGQLSSVDTLLNKDADGVYQDAIKDIEDAGKGGRFILSPDCGMSELTPEENIIAMVKAARDKSTYKGE